jgi:superfamily II DNA or RNA helicase
MAAVGAAFSLESFLDRLPSVCDVLRPHQREQIDRVARALHGGARRLLVQLPTGGGKTHEIAAITLAAAVAGMRVLILATRTRLVRQISERLVAFDVDHGVIAASLPGLINAACTVQVASADTLHRRCIADQRRPLPSADVVIFDEAHLATARSRLSILQQYPNAVWIGFTATPARKSGRSLSAAFDSLIQGPTVLEMIHAGLLVRPRIFNSPIVTAKELKAVPKDSANDYKEGALGELLSRPKLIGDVVSNWLRIAAGKRTLVFAVNKAHGAQLVQEFCRAGIAAELVTDQDDEKARELRIARLECGQTQILVNCFLLSYGIDLPAVECIVLARPTRSLSMYLQMTGRGLRPAQGKEHCVLIDHGRVIETLGLPTADFRWTLDERRNVNREAIATQRRQATIEQPRTCPECAHIWLVSEDGMACKSCGWAPAPKARAIHVQDAELAELVDDAETVTPMSPHVLRFFCEALGDYARIKPEAWLAAPNKARAASWHAAREKFRLPDGRVPSVYWQLEPILPSPETAGWLKYRRIRYAKGIAKSRAA